MTESIKPPGGSVLQRWSQRKHEAARLKETAAGRTAEQSADKSADQAAEKFSAPSAGCAAAAPLAAAAAARPAPEAAPGHGDPLPPVESLTIDSDFSPFLQPKVDDALKRQALKQLFRDPHFNVMDGLDIYIGDYSQPDPIEPDIVRQMVQGRYIFDPPPTRINAQGFVEDVPADELVALEGDPTCGRGRAARTGRGRVPARRRCRRPPEGAAARVDPPAAKRARSRNAADRSFRRNSSPSSDESRRQASPSLLVQRHDAARLGRAREGARACGRTRRADDALPEGALGVRGSGRRATSSSRARRRRGCSAKSQRKAARRRRSGSSTSAKPEAGPPKRRRPRPRSPRCSRLPGCPSPRPCRAWRTAPKAACSSSVPPRRRCSWAKSLSAQLGVTVLLTGRATGAELPAEREFPVYSRRAQEDLRLARRVRSRVGAGKPDRPRPLHALQCVRARVSRECDRLRLPGRPRALQVPPQMRRRVRRDGRDRLRAERTSRGASISILFSTSERTPSLAHAPAAAGLPRPRRRRRWRKRWRSTEIATMTGEFEKPKYFAYKASICAHSRSRQRGCNLCIDVCSTAAIAADGDHVKVEPQLCMGCGACATVCPSGAMSYAYPAVPDLGAQIRTLLATYAKAGGRDACLLLHAEDGRAAIANLARRGRGLAGAGHPVRSASRCVGRARRVARPRSRMALRRSQCSRPAPKRRSTARRSNGRWASPTRSSRRWATRASISGWSTAPIRRRSIPRCGRGRRR